MNVLEGLRRVAVLLSAVIVLFFAFVGWDEGRRAYWCDPPVDIRSDLDRDTQDRYLRHIADAMKEGTYDRHCSAGAKRVFRQTSLAVGYALIAAASCAFAWACFRWVLLGFFPRLRQL